MLYTATNLFVREPEVPLNRTRRLSTSSDSSFTSEDSFHDRFNDGLFKLLENAGISEDQYDEWLFEPDSAEKKFQIESVMAVIMK